MLTVQTDAVSSHDVTPASAGSSRNAYNGAGCRCLQRRRIRCSTIHRRWNCLSFYRTSVAADWRNHHSATDFEVIALCNGFTGTHARIREIVYIGLSCDIVIWIFLRSRSIAINVSVCLFACLSLRFKKNPHVKTSPNFLYMLPVAVARSSSDGSAICYVIPVLWMTVTTCFHIMKRIGKNQRRRIMFRTIC